MPDRRNYGCAAVLYKKSLPCPHAGALLFGMLFLNFFFLISSPIVHHTGMLNLEYFIFFTSHLFTPQSEALSLTLAADKSFIQCLFEMMRDEHLFVHAVLLTEEVLALRDTDAFPVVDIRKLQKIHVVPFFFDPVLIRFYRSTANAVNFSDFVATLKPKDIAFFCRLLDLLIYEPESRKEIEGKCKSSSHSLDDP
jgi:hypothetical protein